MSRWDPALYLQFDSERSQPSIDLAARVPLAAPERIADLGCGPGNSTAVLARRWPEARITAVDNSPEMLERARREGPPAEWILADLAAWAPAGSFDLVFSNAALQWVHGHDRVLPRLMELVAPGGYLAAQIPWHLHSVVHRLIEQTAREGPWAGRTPRAREIFDIREPADYYDILTPVCSKLEMWVTEYLHVLECPDAIVEWMRGTGLRPYLERLEAGEQARFLEDLRSRLAPAFPPRADGRVIYPFPRLFLLARA